jgi:hypothetical protein
MLILFWSCGIATSRHKVEMSLAQAAFLAAKESGADVHASNLYRQAEDYYLKAKSAYRRKYFNKAQEYALLSKKFSEQAEYAAVRKKALEGNAE